MSNLKSFILFLVTIIVLGFFDAQAISATSRGQIITLASFCIIMVNLLLLGTTIEPLTKDSFIVPINLLFVAIFISMIPAYVFHDQSFFSSIRGYRHYYVFFLYFILFKLNFSYDQVLKICIILFYTTLLIYLVDYLTFPNSFFADNSFERRGALTIRFAGQGFTVLGTFYSLSVFFRTNKFLFFILFVVAFCFNALFSASRILLLALIVNTIFMLIYYRKRINRYLIYFLPLLIIAIVLGVYFLETYVLGLFNLAVEEISSFESNIRFLAMKYFTSDFQPSLITKLIGNGLPQVSTSYNDAFERIESYGFYTSDIGLIGLWVYFGLLAVISWLIIFKRIFISKTDDNNIFIKTYFIFLLFTIFLGYPIFSPGYMITTVFCLFLFDKNRQFENKLLKS